MAKVCCALLAMAAAVLAGFTAQAAQPTSVGYILEVEGQGRVVNPELQRDLAAEPQLPLMQGDRISAGPDSEIRVVLADESLVQVGAESTVSLNDFLHQPDQGRREVSLELPAGKVRVLVNDLLEHRRHKFEVKTPTAVAAVRGTLFLVLVESPDSTVVLGYDNPVEVFNRADRRQAVTVAQRQFTSVGRGQAPSPPAPASARRLKSYQLLFQEPLAGSDEGGGQKSGETSLPVGVSPAGAEASPLRAVPPAPSGAPGVSASQAGNEPAAAASPPGASTVGQPPGQVVKSAPTSEGGLALPPGQGGTPPGQGGTPPGQGQDPSDDNGTPPGQGGTPPGQDKKDDTPPGQGGTPPGQDKKDGTPPGQGGTPPGQDKNDRTPPGPGGTPPGPGQEGRHPPGPGRHPAWPGRHPAGPGRHPPGPGRHPAGPGQEGQHPARPGRHPARAVQGQGQVGRRLGRPGRIPPGIREPHA